MIGKVAAASSRKISIIVATLNSEKTIDECLKAIFELDYPKDSVEVIVADGLSKDATLKIAEKYPVKVISAPLNAPAAYNYAMKTVRYDVIGFVDSDAKVEREWLNKLVTYLDDPQVAGVAGDIETWNADDVWSRVIGYDLKYRYHRVGKYVTRIATMDLLLKKGVIEEVGGFDEDLPSQYDTDLGVRITAKGYRIAFDPDAKCYHFNRPTLRGFFKQQLQYGKNTSKLYFKHAGLVKGDAITDVGMNIQPLLILAAILFFLAGIFNLLRPLWFVSAAILLALFIYYILSAALVSVRFKDSTAMLLVVIYSVRVVAWIMGAAIFAVASAFKGRR